MAVLAYWELFLSAFGLTLGLALTAFAASACLGLAGAWLAFSGQRLTKILLHFYVSVLRSVPELLVILLAYYGLSAAWSSVAGEGAELSPFLAGAVALSVVFSAYFLECFRGALESVGRGPVEAARALGLSRWQMFRLVQAPLLGRIALPSIGNLWMAILKDTALVSVIGISDLLRTAKLAAESTQKPFEAYIAVAALYLFITTISMWGQDVLERRQKRGGCAA